MTKITQEQALTDNFDGDNAHLIRSIEALIALNDKGALAPHGIGGHARALLSSAAVRLTQQAPVSGLEWVGTDGNNLALNGRVIAGIDYSKHNGGWYIMLWCDALAQDVKGFGYNPDLASAKSTLETAAREWLKMPAPAPMPSRHDIEMAILGRTAPKAAEAVLDLIRKTQERG